MRLANDFPTTEREAAEYAQRTRVQGDKLDEMVTFSHKNTNTHTCQLLAPILPKPLFVTTVTLPFGTFVTRHFVWTPPQPHPPYPA